MEIKTRQAIQTLLDNIQKQMIDDKWYDPTPELLALQVGLLLDMRELMLGQILNSGQARVTTQGGLITAKGIR